MGVRGRWVFASSLLWTMEGLGWEKWGECFPLQQRERVAKGKKATDTRVRSTAGSVAGWADGPGPTGCHEQGSNLKWLRAGGHLLFDPRPAAPLLVSSWEVGTPAAHGQRSSLPELGDHWLFSLAGSALGAPWVTPHNRSLS